MIDLHAVKGVCCTPFKQTGVTIRNVGGLRLPTNSVDVAELKVLLTSLCVDNFGNKYRFRAGDKVYVPGNLFSTTWAKEQWTMPGSKTVVKNEDGSETEIGEGVKFILVPPQEILLVRENFVVPECPEPTAAPGEGISG